MLVCSTAATLTSYATLTPFYLSFPIHEQPSHTVQCCVALSDCLAEQCFFSMMIRRFRALTFLTSLYCLVVLLFTVVERPPRRTAPPPLVHGHWTTVGASFPALTPSRFFILLGVRFLDRASRAPRGRLPHIYLPICCTSRKTFLSVRSGPEPFFRVGPFTSLDHNTIGAPPQKAHTRLLRGLAAPSSVSVFPPPAAQPSSAFRVIDEPNL